MAAGTVQLGAGLAPENRLGALWSFLREELKPFPGRYTMLFRLVASIVLALWIDLAFDLKDIGLGLYIPFFLVQGSVKKNTTTLVMFVVTCFLCVLYMLFVMNVLSGSPAVRFVSQTLIMFVGVFFIQAAKIGQPWLVLALFGATFVRSWDANETANYVVSSNLSLVLTILIGAASTVAVQWLVTWKRPLQEVRESLSASFGAVITTLEAHAAQGSPKSGQKQLQKLALSGGTAAKGLLADAGKRNPRVELVRGRLSGSIEALTVLVDQALSFSLRFGDSLSEADRAGLRSIATELRRLQHVLRDGEAAAADPPFAQATLTPTLAAMGATVRTLAAVLAGVQTLPEGRPEKSKGGLLKPGALANKDNLLSACKTTLAATLCYGIYTGIDWPQISTSVTTCIITTEDSVGMDRQKQVLRLIGDTVAGLCAIAAICFVLPHLSSIAGLTVVVAVMTLVGGYLFLGSYKLSYAGRQLSYCFFLATMTGNSTPNSLNEARNRVAGVVLGVCMMWLISDQIKPVRTTKKMREAVVGALDALDKLCPLRAASSSPQDKLKELIKIRSAFGKSLQMLQLNTELRAFETTMTQASHRRRLPVIQKITAQLLQVFVRDIAAVEGDIFALPAAGQQPCSPAGTMRKLAEIIEDAAKTPFQERSSADDAVLEQVQGELAKILTAPHGGHELGAV